MFRRGDDKLKHRGQRGEILPQPHEGLPDSERPSGLCPRCGKQSSFEALGSLPLTFSLDVYSHGHDRTVSNPHVDQVTALRCRHCRQGLAVVEEQYIGGRHHSESNSGTMTWRGVHWWPLPSATVSRDIPAPISGTFDEAARTLAAGCPRASAVMARRTLEAICVEQGAESGTLAERLSALATSGRLQPTLAEWAKEVRLIGNLGAHFDPIDDVNRGDAQQLISFLRELLKYLYELPAELRRRRESER